MEDGEVWIKGEEGGEEERKGELGWGKREMREEEEKGEG